MIVISLSIICNQYSTLYMYYKIYLNKVETTVILFLLCMHQYDHRALINALICVTLVQNDSNK